MQGLIIALLTITITLAARFGYVRFFVKHAFDPFSILLLSILGCVSLLLAITLLLHKTGARETIGKVWLVIISVSITYMMADLVASHFLIQRLSPLIIPDQYRHHKIAPNTRSEIPTDEYSYVQTANNLGLRGRDIQVKKAQDHYRILMLGDSFTMGKGVNDGETFSALLEVSLNRKRTGIWSKTIEVLNAGVDSYAPILSFLQLTKDLRPLEPDLVIFNLDMSDLIQEMAYRKNAAYGTVGEILGVDGRAHEPRTLKVRHWIDRNLYITRLLLFYFERQFTRQGDATLENVVDRINPEVLKHTLAADTADRNEQWQYIFESISQMKSHCDKNGMKFLLTVYPWGHQVSDKEWIPGRFAVIPEGTVVSDKSIDIIEEFATKNNIDFLNVFAAFRAYKGTSPLYFGHDIHWTPTGHKIMAQEIERYVQATYLEVP